MAITHIWTSSTAGQCTVITEWYDDLTGIFVTSVANHVETNFTCYYSVLLLNVESSF